MARRASVGSETVAAALGSADERLDKLPGLAARIDSAKSVSDDARSDMGNIYKEAEDQGFNRRALKEAVRLRKMEPEKRRDYLSSLNAYCDKLGVWSQGDLFDEQPTTPTPPPLVDGNEHAAANARGIGRQDGLAGARHGAHLFPQGTPDHADYELGFVDGQREIAISLEAPKSNGSGRRKRAGDEGEDQPNA